MSGVARYLFVMYDEGRMTPEGTKFTPKNHAKLLAQVAENPDVTVQELADYWKVSRETIAKWLRRPLGFEARNGRPPSKASDVIAEGSA